MGGLDKGLRVLAAIVFVYLFYSGIVSGAIGYAFLVFAGIFVLTSLVSFCPLYTFIGVTTCKTK
jgi:hypothetical protein